MTKAELASYIDHTNLKPDATENHIRQLCQDALNYHFAAVCIHPVYIPVAVSILSQSRTQVCTVVGFPLGSNTTETKVFETEQAISVGATEIDMVLHIGSLKAGRDQYVLEDIRSVVNACHVHQAICKVIIETAMLTDDEKIRACRLVRKAGADFIKTSTGFGPGGATVDDVMLLSREMNGTSVRVKAAGGIRSYDDALRMIKAGADRLGTSSGVKIIEAL